MNQSCKQVVISSKAYLSIFAETYERFGTETGGILLGKRVDDIWYVLENLDPGPNSVFRSSYFEYDTPYVNHLANKTARFYKVRLELLGLWHRHPGSFDSFSSTDDGTNSKYAAQSPFGAVSALVNLDPDLRITMYHVSIPLRYDKVPIRIGDESIPNDLKEMKELSDFERKVSASVTTSVTPKPLTERRVPRIRPVEIKREIGFVTKVIRSASDFVSRIVPGGKPHHSRSSSPSQTSVPVAVHSSEGDEKVFEMLDAELNYLESQAEYSYEIQMTGQGEITISLTYTQLMKEYPPNIECVLKANVDGKHAVLDGVSCSYQPDLLRSYIHNQVTAAVRRLDIS